MLVSSLRIGWYTTWHILTWPELWPSVKLWPWPFKVNLVSFDLSWWEEHNGGKIVALDVIGKKLLKKNICARNWCMTSVNFDLWSLNRWPWVKYEAAFQIGCFVAHLPVFFPLVVIYHSLGSRAAQLKPCTFDRKVRTFCNDYFIWSWKHWPRITKFAP